MICAGLQSSGSTWLFNAVADLLRRGVRNVLSRQPHCRPEAPAVVAQFYADTLEAFPDFPDLPDYLVIKTHLVGRSLCYLARFMRCPGLITLREPRDAVASLMLRFGHSFEAALHAVTTAAARLVQLSQIGSPLILRYENRFFDKKETLAIIADHLMVSAAETICEDIWLSLTPDAVVSRIEELTLHGAFGSDAHPDRFDPQTHWHPRHVGRRTTGAYLKVLSDWQQALVTLSTKDYCRYSQYSVQLPSRFSPSLLDKDRPYLLGTNVSFRSGGDGAKFLGDGWSVIEPNHVWGIAGHSTIFFDLGDLPEQPEEYRVRIDLRPFTKATLPSQHLSVIVNGKSLSDVYISGGTTLQLWAPRALLQARQPVAIELIHPDYARPCDHLPGSRDQRMVSIALQSLEIAVADRDPSATASAAPCASPAA